MRPVRPFLPLALACLLALSISTTTSANQRVQGWCEQGAQAVVLPGAYPTSTTQVQRSYPKCTVTVYVAGSGATLATLYSDNAGTALANPFTADSFGHWFFYSAPARLDVQLSGAGFPSPYTVGDIQSAYTNYTASIKDFGAKCDGSDDTSAVQRTLSSLPTGGTATIPAGCATTLASTVTMYAGTTFQGAGLGATINCSNGAVHCVQAVSSGHGSRNITVRDLLIQDTASSRTAGAGVNIDGTGSAATFILENLQINGFQDGVSITDTIYSSIRKVVSNGATRYGFSIWGDGTSLGFDGTYATNIGSDCYHVEASLGYSTFSHTAADLCGRDAYSFHRVAVSGFRTKGLTMISPGAEIVTRHGFYGEDIEGLVLLNPEFLHTGGDGIHLEGVLNASIFAPQPQATTGYGISVTASATPRDPADIMLFGPFWYQNTAGTIYDPLGVVRQDVSSSTTYMNGAKSLKIGADTIPYIQPTVDGPCAFAIKTSTGFTVMCFDTTNRFVGIGTSSPAVPLHVSETSASVLPIAIFSGDATGKTQVIRLDNTAVGGTSWKLGEMYAVKQLHFQHVSGKHFFFDGVSGANNVTPPTTFTNLPTCDGNAVGMAAYITDSNTVVWGAAAAGGGASKVGVRCNGTAWSVESK